MCSLDQWFTGMTGHDAEMAMMGWPIPREIRSAIYNAAASKLEVGIGAGPTLKEVIDHYRNESAYGKLRLLPDALLQHMLDKALQYTDVGAWNDTTRFKLPSIRYHMDTYNVGQFSFMTSEYYTKHIAPQVKQVKAKLRECMPFIKEFEDV